MYCIFVFPIITLYLPIAAFHLPSFFSPQFRPFFHFHLFDTFTYSTLLSLSPQFRPNSSISRRNFCPTLLMHRHSSTSAHYSSSSTTQPSRCLPIEPYPECPDCGMKLVRLVSNSTLNPGKIYYKCSTNKSVHFSIHSILGFSISTGF
jgi:hypothetical protein